VFVGEVAAEGGVKGDESVDTAGGDAVEITGAGAVEGAVITP
jgi:hypothetical protein